MPPPMDANTNQQNGWQETAVIDGVEYPTLICVQINGDRHLNVPTRINDEETAGYYLGLTFVNLRGWFTVRQIADEYKKYKAQQRLEVDRNQKPCMLMFLSSFAQR